MEAVISQIRKVPAQDSAKQVSSRPSVKLENIHSEAKGVSSNSCQRNNRMKTKVSSNLFMGLILSLALLNCGAVDQGEPETVPRERRTRQSSALDTCLIGCVTSAVTNIGVTNLRPSSWSLSMSDLLQSALLRSFCQAYDQARHCINSCSISPSRLLISSLMGVPGVLCTGSPGARGCLQNVSKTMQNTCDNKCRNIKPSFGLRTWLSRTRMKNIFNDICTYWGCQIACERPAVEQQCGEESKSLMGRISGIGMGALKNALKSAGLASVCGENATRIPNTYEIVTETPMINGGDGGDDWGDGHDDGQSVEQGGRDTEAAIRLTGSQPASGSVDVDENGAHLADEDYWHVIRTGDTSETNLGRQGERSRSQSDRQIPSLNVRNTDSRTGETQLKLNN